MTVDHDVFWSRVRRGGADECWPWLGGKVTAGYGHIQCGKRVSKAHRLAWSFANGAIPAGAFICHKCDNPSCCNPAHLFAGSPLDNMRDKIAKGRQRYVVPHGERNGMAKLSDHDVSLIRQLDELNIFAQKTIATLFLVDRSTISGIVSGKHRRQVGFTELTATRARE